MEPTDSELPVPDNVNLSEAIVLGIAEQKDVTPYDMPTLYETINPVALNELFHERQSGRVSFEYAGFEVVVHGPERVAIHRSDPPALREQGTQPDDESVIRLTCTVCDWEATSTADDARDVSQRAIDHISASGHSPVRKVGEISI